MAAGGILQPPEPRMKVAVPSPNQFAGPVSLLVFPARGYLNFVHQETVETEPPLPTAPSRLQRQMLDRT